MKTINIIVLALIALGLSACGKWLDVKSQSEVEVEDLFATIDGYYQSLTGVYVSMGDAKLYGGNLSLTAMEPLSGQYSVSAQKPEREAWRAYNYTEKESQSTIEKIWLSMYNAIVNCNLFITNIERDDTPLFDPGVKEVMLGEALALRAYMYFDLVRIFNESLAVNPASNNVPMKNDFGIVIGERLSTEKLLAKLMGDLSKSRALLKSHDPIVTGKELNDTYVDYDRTRRMNYYAVEALSARISLFLEDYAAAYAYADEVIASTKFKFITPEQIVVKDNLGYEITADRECTPEQVFALDCENVTVTSRSMYEPLTEDFVLGTGCYSPSDIRLAWYYKNPSANGKIQLIKYRRPASSAAAEKYKKAIVPMLKLGEMYLIAEEALSKAADIQGNRLSYINTLKAARTATPQATSSNLEVELTHEYICEFRGEGQLFYYYKRMAMARIDNGLYNGNTNEIAAKSYTLPRPQDEDNFGN